MLISVDSETNALSSKRVAPRLFCDICDMFDLHNTDDCPVQASSSSPVPVSYQSSHSAGRPYCDICEGNIRSVSVLSNLDCCHCWFTVIQNASQLYLS